LRENRSVSVSLAFIIAVELFLIGAQALLMYQQTKLLNAQVDLMEQQNQLLNAQNKLIKQQNTMLNAQTKLQALSLINVPKLNIKFHNKKFIISIYYNGKLELNVYSPTLYFFTESPKSSKPQANAYLSLEQISNAVKEAIARNIINDLADKLKKDKDLADKLKKLTDKLKKNKENDGLFRPLPLKFKLNFQELLKPSYLLLPEKEVIFETDKNSILQNLKAFGISNNKNTHDKQCLKKLYVLVEVIFKSKFGWEYPIGKLVILDLINNRIQHVKEDELLTFFTNKHNTNLMGIIKINSPITPTKKATNPFTLY